MSATAAAVRPSIPERWPPLWWVLVRHEWRLTLREAFNAWRRKKALVQFTGSQVAVRPRRRVRRILGIVVLQIGLHAVGLATLALPRTWHDDAASRMAALVILAFLATFMLSYAMSRVVTAFHERRDLDLLLAAPIEPRLLLAVRSFTVATATAATFAVFVFPVVDVGVITGHWWMARLYVLVPLLAFLTTALALSLTDLFVRAVGVRRARIGLQVFSGLVGASVYLISQARQLLPQPLAASLKDWFASTVRVDDAPWPVAAVAALANGEWSAWLVLAVGVALLWFASVAQAQKRFADIAQLPEGESRSVRVARPDLDRRIARGFGRSLFATLLAKEWKLILRARQLISQVLLQVLYLMPMMFVAFSDAHVRRTWGDATLAAGVVGVGATLATSLAWLTISGEDAPDLLAGSPRRQTAIIGAKLTAATIPPLCFVLLAAIGTAFHAPAAGASIALFGILGCGTAAILAVASPAPGRRSDFQRRHQGRTGGALIEMLQLLLWAGSTGAAVSGYWLISAPLTLAALVSPGIRLPRALATLRDREP